MTTAQFHQHLQEATKGFTPVVNATYKQEEYYPIDLSNNNKALHAIDVSSSSEFDTYITQTLKKHNKRVAYGGYIEQRDIYNRSTHFNQNNVVTERNIHLGLDIWIDAGTSVLAALNGEIHSFANNDNFGDYGPTIILKHSISDFTFYTLYGHLSLESLTSLRVGERVKQGEIIADLGTAEVNGDYAPHLHFQIIKDMEEYTGDYPGVTSKQDLDFYKNNCPDPNLLLKIA